MCCIQLYNMYMICFQGNSGPKNRLDTSKLPICGSKRLKTKKKNLYFCFLNLGLLEIKLGPFDVSNQFLGLIYPYKCLTSNIQHTVSLYFISLHGIDLPSSQNDIQYNVLKQTQRFEISFQNKISCRIQTWTLKTYYICILV